LPDAKTLVFPVVCIARLNYLSTDFATIIEKQVNQIAFEKNIQTIEGLNALANSE